MEASVPTAAERPQRGEELELTVESLAYGGAGVARRHGYVVFVQGAVPGDRARVLITKSKRAYGEARAVEIVEPSPERVPAAADHPGAPWQVLSYQRQLEVKRAQVDDALRRIGKLAGYELDETVPAVEQWRYRNKLEYSFGAHPRDGRLICGFHAPGRWHDIVEVTDCMLASERSNAAREAIVGWCRDAGLTAYDRRSGEGMLRNLVVREGRRSGQLQARLVTSGAAATAAGFDREALARAAADAGLDGVLWTRVDSVAEVTHSGDTELIHGSDRIDEQLGGLHFSISPSAFFQTNTEMAEQLLASAIELAELRGFERLYDLYCGIGTIGLLMAPRVAEVWGLELVEDAIADAIANAQRNEIDNARFFAGDVRLAMRELVRTAGRPDVLVLDPPRAGLSQKVVRRIIEAGPNRIVYVSCNPTTLAPNAAQLVEAGYKLTRVRPIDMFPQTPHIECVALLTRR
jgi:23S rRNA (uracil1939-C5)-methyltransferase